MYIRKITIDNYKGFYGSHTLEFSKNLSFFVGDNNTGKSSIFEALEFVKSGLPSGKEISDIKNKKADGPVKVVVTFKGNIKEIIENFSEKKYLKYLFEDNNEETLLVQRSSEVLEIEQSGKKVEINIKKVTLWNPESEQFENPSGIDTVFKTLFEAQFVWADTNPDDISDFGTTKICGRLLTSSIGDFFISKQWSAFTEVHEKTFHKGSESLSERTKSLEKDIKSIILEQYGPAEIKFNFRLPEPASFLKSGGINIDDGADTSSKDKGTGMQRALALALIQVYADSLTKHPEDPSKTKPLFLFIDEPETFLHPKAQTKLLDALHIISQIRQVFITTHSPYLLRSFDKDHHSLHIFSKSKLTNQAVESESLSLFGQSSPTWGEINYFAYGISTVEFHNELYGFIQAKAVLDDEENYYEDNFEEFLVRESSKLSQSKDYKRLKKDGSVIAQQRTLPTYIRNVIHHPENSNNPLYTTEELDKSIDILIKMI